MSSRKRKPAFKFLLRMKKRLAAVFLLVVLFLVVMIGRLIYIETANGTVYDKKVLAQQETSSKTIPFRRGDIVDRKGTVLATSTDVYNVILDCSVLSSDADYMEPTLAALSSCFEKDEINKTVEEIRAFVAENPNSQYCVLSKKPLPYEEVQNFEEKKQENNQIKGIWFEKEYSRVYPYGSLASALIGHSAAGNNGLGGIEEQYQDVLNGTDGRMYSYMNSDSNYEINVKEAINGQTVVSTIDANLQNIVESKVNEFSEKLRNNATTGAGAKRIGVMMMDPNTGEVLAMASYPNYDYSLSSEENMALNYTDADLEGLTEEGRLNALVKLQQNVCLTYTYEPGSTAKPFTVACGLETGTLNENMTFNCNGYEKISGHTIHCVNRNGHGIETLSGSLEDSCNDALMQMSYRIGAHNFARYQQLFNFGLKTNIDLPGETRTDSLIYSEDQLNTINLATNSFGQNFNVTMVQVISAYSSLVNGGSYYQPHVVRKILDEDGNTVEEIAPQLIRQTVSEKTSETLKGYLEKVVSQGTGKLAKVDGYSMCGKTGTAQKYVLDEDGNATSVRDRGKYLVSFIGSVPANDPQVVIYCFIDEPNVEDQAHSSYAQHIVREIMEEALPYMNIYPDEESTGVNTRLNIIGEEGIE